MTPFAALVIALVAALVERDARRARLAAIPPWLAVLSVQTWGLATGHGDNPPRTIANPGYWVFQLVVLGVLVGIAGGFGSLLRSRASVGSRRHIAFHTVVAGGVSLAVFMTMHSPSRLGHGNGKPPLLGIVGMVACTLTLIAVGAARLVVGRRRAKTQRDPRLTAFLPASGAELSEG